MFVKICGITNQEDALAAVECGADAVGFNFWRPGKRYIAPQRAAAIAALLSLKEAVKKVGVFVDEDLKTVEEIAAQVGLDVVQLHGQETPEYVTLLGGYEKWKAVTDTALLPEYAGVSAFLLDTPGDTPGGTGRTFDWSRVAAARAYGRVILAGGLTPANVGEAVRQAHPWGVDVASGVESAPGRKDHAKMRDFVAAAREAA